MSKNNSKLMLTEEISAYFVSKHTGSVGWCCFLHYMLRYEFAGLQNVICVDQQTAGNVADCCIASRF